MKKAFFTMLIIVIISSAYPIDDLWKKAQDLAENSWRLVPGKTTTTVETFQGGVTQGAGTTIVKSIYLSEDGKIVSETLPMENELPVLKLEDLENLEELLTTLPNHEEGQTRVLTLSDSDFDMSNLPAGTHTIQHVASLPDTKNDLTPKKEGIFFEKNKKFLTLKKVKGTKTIEGKLCQGYKYDYTKTGLKKDREQGTIWLDTITGSPVLKEPTAPKDLISTETTISNVYYGYNYNTRQFYPKRIESMTNISVPIVNLKMNIKSTTIEEDHWEY